MKAIVGVDGEGHYQAALHLLSRLSFQPLSAELLHVVDPSLLTMAGVMPPSYGTTPAGDETWSEQADAILAESQAEATALGIESTVLGLVGKPNSMLIERGSEIHADILAVGSTHKSRYGTLVLGSVGRSLTIGALQSLLIAKEDFEPKGPITAVFATDGSDYADECLRMLARMRPVGITRLVVVTAVEDLKDTPAANGAREHVNGLVSHLCESGFHAEAQVVEGSPAQVIDAMMKSVGARLLIMGAQGHGFFNRLLVGSLSLQEVVATPHSILLLRLP